MNILYRLLCAIGLHQPVEEVLKGSVYEYDMVCRRCRRCQKLLSPYHPK